MQSYNNTYLKDSKFLEEIDKMKIKEQFVKITALDFKTEERIESLEGKVVSGSVSLNGNSSVRRTCNLTMILDNTNNNIFSINNVISINRKIDVKIGFTNTTNKYTEYDIIWIPLGIYLIITPNISRNAQGITISLQLKDKMCLLNGECGGVLPASVIFHEREEEDDNGDIIITRPTIYQIIQELVNHLGGEPLHNIFISDIEQRKKQMYRWTGSKPIYIKSNDKCRFDFSIGEPKEGYTEYGYGECIGYKLTDFTYPGTLISQPGETIVSVLDKIKNTLGNYEYFYDIEGRFVFREIRNYLNTTQATVTLNALKDGSFDKNDYKIDITKGKAGYIFDDATLISSYTMNPNYSNIKNDFLVWGVKKTGDGKAYPIRYHLAIDKKPIINNNLDEKVYPYIKDYSLEDKTFETDFSFLKEKADKQNEYILKRLKEDYEEKENERWHFQDMYRDIRKMSLQDPGYTAEEVPKMYKDFYEKNRSNGKISLTYKSDKDILENKELTDEFKSYLSNLLSQTKDCIDEITGYLEFGYGYFKKQKDHYFGIIETDGDPDKYLRSFIELKFNYDYYGIHSEDSKNIKDNLSDIYNASLYIITNTFLNRTTYLNITDWRTMIYVMCKEDEEKLGLENEQYNSYYLELKNEWLKIYDILKADFKVKNALEINYFLDFIDSDSEIGDLSVQNIGRRSKVVSNDKINTIFDGDEPPNIILLDSSLDTFLSDRRKCIEEGNNFFQIPQDIANNISLGGYYQSAYEEAKSLLYQHSSYNETISITAIPIYYLEPNTRITVIDEQSSIQGDYLISNITLPLDINGTMNISASKAIEKY